MSPESLGCLRRSVLLRFMPEEHRDKICALFTEVRFNFGESVIEQDDVADSFYVITRGRVRVVKLLGDGRELALNVLREGEQFGESALLTGGRRSATVRCSTSVAVARLDREDFLRLAGECPEFRDYLELSLRWQALRSFLYEHSDFGNLPLPAMQALIQELRPLRVASGGLIVREGDPAGPMFILREGRVRVYVERAGRQRDRAFLQPGEFFGERSVLLGGPRTATAVAVTDCELLVLESAEVERLRALHPEFARLLEQRQAQYALRTSVRVPLGFHPAPGAASPGDSSAEGGAEEADLAGGVPWVSEETAGDGGAACLAMICRHRGRVLTREDLHRIRGAAGSGWTLSRLCQAAAELGLPARALRVSPRELRRLPVPAIAQTQTGEWIVVHEVSEHRVRTVHPRLGLREGSVAEVTEEWSGQAALFDFAPEGEPAGLGRLRLAWMLPFFRRHRRPLLQAAVLTGVTSGLQLLLPVFTQVLIDSVLVDLNVGLLYVLVLATGISGLFLFGAQLLQQFLLSFVTVRIDAAVIDFLTRRLLALPLAYFTGRRAVDIHQRLVGARQVRDFVLQQGLQAALAGVSAVGASVLMAWYSPFLFGVFLLSLPFYAGLVMASHRVLKPIFAGQDELQVRYSALQVDALKGIEAIKAAGAELHFRDRMLHELLGLSRRMFRGNFLALSYENALHTVGLLNTTLLLLAGALQVIDGRLSVGVFVAFLSLLGMAHAALVRLLGVWDDVELALVQLDNLRDILVQEPEQGHERGGLRPVPTLAGRIQLQRVSFRYGGLEAPAILRGITLEITAGMKLAIVGRSGSGKTTLVKVMAGLLQATEGTILFDRVDLRALNYRDLRRQVGLVLQENHLFSDTILQNISFGDPAPDVDRVLEAARLANAHDFIMRLPDGYDTRVGETGLALSGGQRQRIAIARALYPDPAILIFDEATSALDTESEQAIQQNLARMIAGRTSILIAHRLSTIRDADRIVVLEGGAIAEMGTHDELMARRGLYFYLSSQQLRL